VLFSANTLAHTYISDDGDEYTIRYNKHGAILTSVNKKHYPDYGFAGAPTIKRVRSIHLKLYLGKDCDAISNSRRHSKGIWEWDRFGFYIQYYGMPERFVFVGQKVSIPGMHKCKK